MAQIQNPILKGFHPDPAICKGHDGAWYIATSTFEWAPGVAIYRSEDLQDWQLVATPINEGFIDLEGTPPSGGVWAPCLTYSPIKKRYYLVYSNVINWRGFSPSGQSFKDVTNYITSSETVDGQWSTPINCGGGGFDPSLFTDDDGKQYYIWMWWDWRAETIRFDDNIKGPLAEFAGIFIQEFDETQGLIGKPKRIFTNSHVGMTEGPHIYKKDKFYYLMVAEGGTSWEHAVSVARSTDLMGKYELHPQTPLLTVIDRTDWPLQKSGHGSMCEGPTENLWLLAHLVGRPLTPKGACPLGRETALQPIIWKDGWPWPQGGGRLPLLSWQTDSLADAKPQSTNFYVDFTKINEWPIRLMSLRSHKNNDWCQLSSQGLRLKGRHSPRAVHQQSVIGLRVQNFGFRAETTLRFDPKNYHHFAGLSLRYNEENQYQLLITKHPEYAEPQLCLMNFVGGNLSMPLGKTAPKIDTTQDVHLACYTKESKVYFEYKQNGDWQDLGVALDWSPLSDEGAWPLGFTGSFVCLVAHDLLQTNQWATFLKLDYQPINQ